MSNIQKTLDSLQPYVIGIRYLEGTPVVDVVFREGWTVPEDANIKRVKGNDELNYYMIFSEVAGIGLDELLAYVDKTIKLNLDREKKHELLRVKVNELKEVFKKNNLSKLTRLKFSFGEEGEDDMVPDIKDFEVDENVQSTPQPKINPLPLTSIEEPEVVDAPESIDTPHTYLDENKNPIILTDEDREILEEEARAEKNRRAIENKKQNSDTNKLAKKVELPPKRKLQIADEVNFNSDCLCGPNEACEKCMDSKDF